MDRDELIITVYCLVCEHYHVTKRTFPLWRGGFAPALSDEEVTTMELWVLLRNFLTALSSAPRSLGNAWGGRGRWSPKGIVFHGLPPLEHRARRNLQQLPPMEGGQWITGLSSHSGEDHVCRPAVA